MGQAAGQFNQLMPEWHALAAHLNSQCSRVCGAAATGGMHAAACWLAEGAKSA